MVKSSIGKKAIVAITGLGLFAFVFGHMAGNLQFFAGREALNNYGEMLHWSPELLWLVRIGLLTFLVLHVGFTIALWRRNQAARPITYAYPVKPRRSTISSRTMIFSGLLVFSFLIYHLLHFTAHATDPVFSQLLEVKENGRGTGHVIRARALSENGETLFEAADGKKYPEVALRHDVYGMVQLGFSSLPVVLIYAVAQILLAFHLSHGASSMFKSLGLYTPKHARWMDKFGPTLAVVICVGFLVVPLAIQFDVWTGLFDFAAAAPTPSLFADDLGLSLEARS